MSAEGRGRGADSVPPIVRDVLRGIVDYAGLFPPAALSMRDAADRFLRYRGGPDAWALGRFVLLAARLEALAAALAAHKARVTVNGWRASALVGAELEGDLDRVAAFNEGQQAAGFDVAVDTLELKWGDDRETERALGKVAPAYITYVELPLGTTSQRADDSLRPEELERRLCLIRDGGGRAKVRTGGVTAEMFPAVESLLGFLRACVAVDIPFKATAGLHHPVTGRYPLTYQAGSRRADMYGYLNLLFATLLARRGAAEPQLSAALGEGDPGAFQAVADGLAWREHVLTSGDVPALRERSLVAFGSCSFREPIDELPFGHVAQADSPERSAAP